MYPSSSDTPSARGQELVPFKPKQEVLEGRIVDGGPKPFPGFVFTPPVGPSFDEMLARSRRQQASVVDLVLREVWAGFKPMFDDLVGALSKFGEAAKQAGLVAEEPPTDPRARALWMKQHRNHGPETPKNWRKR